MALPASAVITKKISLPDGMSEQELEVQVESEANQYIPFSLDEVSLDFCVIDRKSTRLNSSHLVISYAVFCLKKKNDFPSSTVINLTRPSSKMVAVIIIMQVMSL